MGKTDGLLPFIADHADYLARTAYLLTGDPAAARDLTVRALVTIGRRWPGWYRPQDAAVREIYRGYLAGRPTVPQDFPLSRQSPTGRAAFVALSYGRLPEHVAAEVTGLFQTLRQEWDQAAAQAAGVDLAALAAVPPQVDVADEVMGKLRTHRRRRTGLIAGGSTVAALALVGLLAVQVVTVVGNLSTVSSASSASRAMPVKLTEPVAYAYQGYCEDDSGAECAMWRVVTTSGQEWLVTDAADDQGSIFHVTQDGTRIAYLLSNGRPVAMDLVTGEREAISETDISGSGASFFSSPNGRFIAATSKDIGFTLDFSSGVSDYVPLDDAELIAIKDDGTRLQAEFSDTAAKLIFEDPEFQELTSARVDSGLLHNHAALAQDGHTLAVVSKKGSLVTLDARTGKNTRAAIRLSTTTVQGADVERWLGADEVLVRLLVEDDELFVAANVRTGQVRDYDSRDDLSFAVLGKLK